jgi:hypothetical protein
MLVNKKKMRDWSGLDRKPLGRDGENSLRLCCGIGQPSLDGAARSADHPRHKSTTNHCECAYGKHRHKQFDFIFVGLSNFRVILCGIVRCVVKEGPMLAADTARSLEKNTSIRWNVFSLPFLVFGQLH